jgi:hypothetical protein
VLAFGQRTFAEGITWLPRAGVAWLGETWAPVGAEEDHPWTREAAAGACRVRRALAAALDDRPRAGSRASERETTTIGRRVRYPGNEMGSVKTGFASPRSSPES